MMKKKKGQEKMGKYIENNFLMWVMLGLYIVTVSMMIFRRISIGILAREAKKMGLTNNPVLKQIRLKYENVCRLEREVRNTEELVNKYLFIRQRNKYTIRALAWLILYVGLYAAMYLFYNGEDIRSGEMLGYAGGAFFMWTSVWIIGNLFATDYLYDRTVIYITNYLDNNIRNKIEADMEKKHENFQQHGMKEFDNEMKVIQERQWSNNKVIEEVLREFFVE